MLNIRRVLISLTCCLAVLPVAAHETGDPFHRHSEEPVPVFMQSLRPRVEVKSKDVALLAVLYEGRMTVYADHPATNAPLDELAIELTNGDRTAQAQPAGDGVYQVMADWLGQTASQELTFMVRGADFADSLETRLESKANSMKKPAADPAVVQVAYKPSKPHVSTHGQINKTAIDAGILDVAPQTLVDGSVFVPKPTQRLLGIRTQRGAVRNHPVMMDVAGRVIVDPVYDPLAGPGTGEAVEYDPDATIDPARLTVEAIIYEPALAEQIASAQAVLASDETVPLRYLGAQPREHEHGLPLHFKVDAPELDPLLSATPTLTAGEPLTVALKTKQSILGMALPQESVITGSRGEQRVWLQAAAERFTSQEVRVQAIDDDTVYVLEGLEAGSRVVTQGAALLGQVR